jgi:hypothetical protein
MVTNSARSPFDILKPNLATNKYGFTLAKSVRKSIHNMKIQV